MKSYFSLFEIIIVLILISILTTFIISKMSDSVELSNKTKIRSEIALIRTSINKQKTKSTLLQNSDTFVLDNEQVNQTNSELFKNILDFPLISTNSNLKVLSKWIKKSSNEYIVYLDNSTFLEFKYENFTFDCKSNLELCKEYE